MNKKIKTSIIIIFIAIVSVLLQKYLPNKYSNLYGTDREGSRLINVLRVGKGALDFWRQSQRFLDEQVPDTTPQNEDTFDFIVIGAGTAGATIATRLSEIPQIKVLLIEEGTYERLYMDIPIIAAQLQMTDVARKYQAKPSNKYCLGMKDNRCVYPTGKVVGGSSVLNYMIASRGGAEDYDRWAEMGNEGWAYKDVLKYFKKLETMHVAELKSDSVYHGTDGPVHITQPEFHTPLAEAFLEAGKELGLQLLVDYNGKNQMGFSYAQSTIFNGTRMSSNRAYLNPVRDRKNLRVTLESTVTRVLIDPITNRTTGVEFVKNNQILRVFTNKEVIMCAGAIRSPQLLMLSGIGPKKDLIKLGINVIHDAPVGENLMDHPAFYGLAWTINASISIRILDQLDPTNPYLSNFLIKRTGPLTVPGGIEIIGFINTKHPEKRNGLPDIEIIFGGATFREDHIIPQLLNLKNSVYDGWHKYIGTHGWTMIPVLLKPKSRGRITLLANDINVKPEIVLNFFDDPDDMRTMIAGLRFALRLGQTRTMQAFDSQLMNFTYPECNKYDYDSDAYWECVTRIITSTLFHYSGTCKMGARGDTTAVVDPKLKVINIQGLRVADASVIPEITSGHLSLPVYMIAEKAADLIKKEWGYMKMSQ